MGNWDSALTKCILPRNTHRECPAEPICSLLAPSLTSGREPSISLHHSDPTEGVTLPDPVQNRLCGCRKDMWHREWFRDTAESRSNLRPFSLPTAASLPGYQLVNSHPLSIGVLQVAPQPERGATCCSPTPTTHAPPPKSGPHSQTDLFPR